MTPAEMVRGKRVAIVGGAASIHEHGDGALIDAHDVVIRVNWALPLRGDPKRIGTRTDVMLHPHSARELPKNAIENHVAPWRKDDELGYALAVQHGFSRKTNPRTGVTAVAMVARAGAQSIYLTGYDFYASGAATRHLPDAHMKRVSGATGGHDIRADRVILRSLVIEHGCSVDGVLALALARPS